MASRKQIFLPSGEKFYFEYRIESEYIAKCREVEQQCGIAVFEMCWPNKGIFKVFRDKADNQIEIRFKPLTIGG